MKSKLKVKEVRGLGSRPKLGEMLLQHVIVFLICVVFPGAVTSMAPSTWLSFGRNGDAVNCTTRTCMFFVVPFKIQHIQQVTSISHREREGRTERQRRFGRTTDHYVDVDGEGFLEIHGIEGQIAEVNVSPASLENVVEKCNDFLNTPNKGSITIFAIANWKFGGLMGGVLSSFTLLYVVGYSLTVLNGILTRLKRILFKRQ